MSSSEAPNIPMSRRTQKTTHIDIGADSSSCCSYSNDGSSRGSTTTTETSAVMANRGEDDIGCRHKHTSSSSTHTVQKIYPVLTEDKNCPPPKQEQPQPQPQQHAAILLVTGVNCAPTAPPVEVKLQTEKPAVQRKMVCQKRVITMRLRFTLKDAKVDTSRKTVLCAESCKRLAYGQDIAPFDPAEIPTEIIPTKVTLLSTTNPSPVMLVGRTPWIPRSGWLLENGQSGQFMIPEGTVSYTGPESVLYCTTPEEIKTIDARKRIIGRDVGYFMAQAQQIIGTDKYTIQADSDLDFIYKLTLKEKYNSMVHGKCLVVCRENYEEMMQHIDEDIRRTAPYITKPSKIELFADIAYPARPDQEKKPNTEELLNLIIGDLSGGSEKAKAHYENKVNEISVTFALEYMLLV
jgi:hypothetical protein